jgi:predicted nucleotidyltransferase
VDGSGLAHGLGGGERSLLARAVEELVGDLGDGVVAVALFGSRARGEASEGSDFDLLVVVRGLRGLDRRFKIYDPSAGSSGAT